jgi:hypothetical protein
MCYVTNPYIGIGLLSLGVGSSGLMVSGWHLNHQDLSPRYASVLAGFTAVIGTSAGIISPIVAGLLTKEQVEHFNGNVFSIFYFNFSLGFDWMASCL